MQVKINFIQHKIYFYDYQAGSTKKRTEINSIPVRFSLYAQHGYVLTGESPQCALMTGSI